jgi:hypothetical protein
LSAHIKPQCILIHGKKLFDQPRDPQQLLRRDMVRFTATTTETSQWWHCEISPPWEIRTDFRTGSDRRSDRCAEHMGRSGILIDTNGFYQADMVIQRTG